MGRLFRFVLASALTCTQLVAMAQTPPQVTSVSAAASSDGSASAVVSWSAPVSSSVAYYLVEARQLALFDAFSGTTLGPQWVREPSSVAGSIASVSARPGWMQLRVGNNVRADMWGDRGTAPMYYVDAELQSDYSVSAVFDTAVARNGAANPLWNPQSQSGLMVYDKLPGIASYKLFLFVQCDNTCWVEAAVSGNNANINGIRVPAQFTTSLVHLRIDYSMSKGRYWMYYRYTNADLWALFGTLDEYCPPTYTQCMTNGQNNGNGGKTVQPRVGVATKCWVPSTLYNPGFDVTNFTIASTMPGARPTKFVAKYPASSMTVPLTRYIPFQLGVTSVGTDGTFLPAVYSNYFYVDKPSSGILPYTSGVSFRYDFTGGRRPTRVVGGNGLSGAVPLGTNWPSSSGNNPLVQGRENQRSAVSRYRLYDRASLRCGKSPEPPFSTTNFAEIQNSGGNNAFNPADGSCTAPGCSPVTYSFGGFTVFAVIRTGDNPSAGPIFAKANKLADNSESGGFGLWMDPGNSRLTFRGNWNGDRGGVAYSAPISTSHVHVFTLHMNASVPGRSGLVFSMARDGKQDNIAIGGTGIPTADDFIGSAINTGAWLHFCDQEDNTIFWNGEVFEIIGLKRFMGASDMIQMEQYLRGQYFSECLSMSTSALTNTGTGVAGTAGNACIGGTSANVCNQECTGTNQRVIGSLQRTCILGSWAGGATPACGMQCPALPRPATTTGCTRVLQWEPFAVGTSTSFPELSNRYGSSKSYMSSTLLRWTSFPPAPDTSFPDVWAIVPGSTLISAASGVPSAVTRTLLGLDVDVLAGRSVITGGAYNSLLTWAARDVVNGRNTSAETGEPGNTPLSRTGVLKGQLDKVGRISPLEGGSTFGFGLLQFNSAWQVDSANSASSDAYTYSARMRITADLAGLLFRCNSVPAVGGVLGDMASTRCYLVTVDVELSTIALYKFQNGVLTQLSTVGGLFPRGRWFTLSAKVDASSIQISYKDDDSGVSNLVMAYGEATLPMGTGGPYLDGTAFFDDYQVTAACPASGVCSGIFSNYHTGLGGACIHSCTAGYNEAGNAIRTCQANGTWSGEQLVCSPQPPAWTMQVMVGDGGAVNVGGRATFTRFMNERSPSNTVLPGNPVTASSTSSQTAALPIFYAITAGNVDVDTGLEVFAIGLCDGILRVRNALTDFKKNATWTLTVVATATGDAGATSFVTGTVIINIVNVNDAPAMSDVVFSIPESVTEGFVINTLTFTDPDDGTALASTPIPSIVSGNELGLFALGPNPPLTATTAAAGFLTIAANVNKGTRPFSSQCSCNPKVLDFEGQSLFTLVVKIVDGRVPTLYSTATVTVTLTNVNDAPFIQPSQLLFVDEQSMSSAGAALSGPVLAVDQDAGQTLTYSVTGIWGGRNLLPPNLPSVTSATWPFLFTGASSIMNVRAGGLQTYTSSDTVRMYLGYAARAVYVVQVTATDNGLPSPKQFTTNVTVVVSANATGGGMLGLISAFSAPTAGLYCDGTDVVTVACDYCNLGQPLFATYGPVTNPRMYNSTCTVVSGTTVSAPAMPYRCTTNPGSGITHSWTFYQGTGGSAISLPASSTTVLRTSYAPPFFGTVQILNVYGSISLTNIWSSGTPADSIIVKGRNFGRVRGSSLVSLVGSNPGVLVGGTSTFPLNVGVYNDTTIIFGVSWPGGASTNLRFSITVDGQSTTSPASMAFARPVMRNVNVPASAQYTKNTLSGSGGQQVCMKCWNLGPSAHPGVTGLYHPTMTFGPVTVAKPQAQQGLEFAFVSCARGSAEQEDICCTTPPGMAGKNLIVRINTGAPPTHLQTSWYDTNAINMVSFLPPAITGATGLNQMSTAGGETFRLRGSNFCSPDVFLRGLCPISVSFGPLSSINTVNGTGRYLASNCAPALAASSTIEISCTSPPGTGRNYAVIVTVAGQVSAYWQVNNASSTSTAALGYAAPVYTSFGGVPDSANTLGGDTVLIIGANFGNDAGVLGVKYALNIQTPAIANVSDGSGATTSIVTYLPASCSVSVPHFQISCILSQGVGAALKWAIVVDGVASVQPTTSYAAPDITGMSVYNPENTYPSSSGLAGTDGGNVLRVTGTGFSTSLPLPSGAIPLLQTLSILSPFGAEIAMPRSAFTLVDDGRIDVKLPAGAGNNWAVRVSVADRDSEVSQATFSYSQPVVTSLSPFAGVTGGTRVTVFANDLGLADPTAQVYVLFGNKIDGSLAAAAVRASRVPRPDSDNTTILPYLAGRVTFVAPEGMGSARAVRLITVGGADPVPNVATSVAAPQVATCPSVQGTTVDSLQSYLGSACVGVGFADVLNYAEPVITSVIVTRPSADADMMFIEDHFGSEVSVSDVRRLDIFGAHLGSASFGEASGSSLMGRFVQQLDVSSGPNVWGSDSRFAVPPDASFWSPTQATVFTLLSEGTLRVVLRSGDWSGKPLTQMSNAFPFADYSPTVSLVGLPPPFATTGGMPLSFSVRYLGSASMISVTLGGRPAPICDPSVLPMCSALITTPAAFASAIANNAAQYEPAGVITPETAWTITVKVPAGQGAGLPLIVTRQPDNAASSPISSGLSYLPPSVTGVGVGGADPTAPVALAFDEGARYSVPTLGGRMVISGANLGPCPMLVIASYSLYMCPDASLPAGSAVITDPTSSFYDAYASVSADHASIRFTAPVGEGSGVELLQGDPRGWTIIVKAAGQSHVEEGGGRPVRFGWMPPSVTGITLDAATGAPTRGGVVVTIAGSNFGASVPGFPQSSLPDLLKARVFVGQGFFIDPGLESEGLPVDPAAPWRVCTRVTRLSHSALACTLPEGAGAGLSVRVHVQLKASTTAGPVFSYNAPTLSSFTMLSGTFTYNATTNSSVPDTLSFVGGQTMRGRTAGGYTLTMVGANLGPADMDASCVLFTVRGALAGSSNVPTCDGMETFAGEGEIPPASVVSWSHEKVVLVVPQGTGQPSITLQAAGQRMSAQSTAAAPKFEYLPPVITAILLPAHGSTDGGETVVIVGDNFGPAPSRAGFNASYPTALVTSFTTFSHANVRINWGPLTGAPGSLLPVGACISSARTLGGAIPPSSNGCGGAVLSITHTEITFLTLPGVGANISVSVVLEDSGDTTQATDHKVRWAYDPPAIALFNPNPVKVGEISNPIFRTAGTNFGSDKAFAVFPTADRSVAIAIDGDFSACKDAQRVARDGVELGVECELDGKMMVVGHKNVTIAVAGQTGLMRKENAASLQVVCDVGFFGRPGENCLACPAPGSKCNGFYEFRNASGISVEVHGYPRPLEGFWNLNSSCIGAEPCPASSTITNLDGAVRDVCIVPCDPPEACLADNRCLSGYASVAPAFRCSTCEKGFYKRAGECVRCPDSPAALFIGFILLVLVVAGGGFMLNKRQVNIAVISIGVDFFQVLAIFAQSRVKWPPIVKELLHVLSAFNLNIEIVAPECLIPDVSYKQKFWFIMLLPLCITGIFAFMFVGGGVYKMLVLGRPKKQWWTHSPALVSCCLVLLYLLYLYLTRTIMDVFNCAPTIPPSLNAAGKSMQYLQVVFEECGKPGGTQMTLMGYAIAGIAVYVAGYPLFIGYTLYTSKETVMEDQLLRAKGVGNDRLSNPRAYMFRKTYGRSYFQFKPDWCMWIEAILLRKLCIAITAVVFNRNASFQMAACLLIMFLSYAAQVQIRPYMSPGDYEEVIAQHVAASYTYAIHARLRAAIAGVETRGRKKARKNLLSQSGAIDRSAVLGVLMGFFFNYNTVEAIMQFCAVIVCLMGIMYQANEVNTAYPESRDSVTAVVLIVIIFAIVYFATVFITEIYVLYTEKTRTVMLQRAARGRKGMDADGESKKLPSSGSTGGKRTGRLVDAEGDLNLGKMETATNPMFLTEGGTANTASNGSSASGVEAILSMTEPPAQDLWRMFQATFRDTHEQLEAARVQLIEAKKAVQLGAVSESSTEGDVSEVRRPNAAKTQFVPRAAGGPAVLSSGKKALSMKSLKA